MDLNLLCDENWVESLSSTTSTSVYPPPPPITPTPTVQSPAALVLPPHPPATSGINCPCCINSFYITVEEHNNAFMVCLDKELNYMPESGYLQRLESSHYLLERFNAVQWFIKTRSRLNLSLETIFIAVNYLDRFLAVNHCNILPRIQDWTLELLSMVCFSIAAKTGEVSIPKFHELQLEGLNHSFQPAVLQKTELAVLKALNWRLGSVTAYSFLELMVCHLDSLQPVLHSAVLARLVDLLLHTLSDHIFIQFRPSTVAVAALRCSLEGLIPSKVAFYLSNVITMIPPDQMAEINICHKMMEERVAFPLYNVAACGCPYLPQNPATVMGTQTVEVYNGNTSVSVPSNPKKRPRE